MRNLSLLILGWTFLSLNSSGAFSKEQDWLCTEESSQRVENNIMSCGIGVAPTESDARLKAFDSAKPSTCASAIFLMIAKGATYR